MENKNITWVPALSGFGMALMALLFLMIPFNEPPHIKTLILLALPLAVAAIVFLFTRIILIKIYSKKETDAPDIEEVERLRGDENYRKEFLGNVYHELKTPIFNMQGYILTLLEGGLEDETINRVYLERAEKNINRMISIVEDLESISGLESGALNLKEEEFNIKKLIDDVFEANEMRASKQGISLEASRIKESESSVYGDRKRVYQVLNNLTVNSINYGRRGGRTIVSSQRSGNKLIIEVKDNGIGISKEDIPRIFERFYRVDKSRSRDSGGTGLGLAIAKHIIEAHEQSISINSVYGKGSTFRFSLRIMQQN